MREFLQIEQATPLAVTSNASKSEKKIDFSDRFPPPTGDIIYFSKEGSLNPQFDHVMLSLGDGRAIHLNQAPGSENKNYTALNPGHFHTVDLKEFINAFYEAAPLQWNISSAPGPWMYTNKENK